VKPRDLALAALSRPRPAPGAQEHYLEQQFQKHPDLTARDRAFTVNLVQGVTRWRLRLDWIIQQNTRFPFSKIQVPVLGILRLAVYQIFFLDRVPDAAAVNEAVRQVRRRPRGEQLSRVVNGILRQICRKKDTVSLPDPGEDLNRYLSVVYSYPRWLVDMWIKELGSAQTERLLEAGNRIPEMVIRCNSLRIERDTLMEHLGRAGLSVQATRYAPEGISIRSRTGEVNRMEAFQKGWFQVQGEAAQVCSYLLGPRPGEMILDACAGLGGKSTHMAQLMGGRGRIVALDTYYRSLLRLDETSRRMGIRNIESIAADAADSLPFLSRSRFDGILVDSPCSGLGVLSRHPDGKWIRDRKDIKRLGDEQKRILNRCLRLLRKGGRLLYVTCTISREENEEVVAATLREVTGVKLEDLRHHAPRWAHDLINERGYFKTLPHFHGMDGFFGAMFSKL